MNWAKGNSAAKQRCGTTVKPPSGTSSKDHSAPVRNGNGRGLFPLCQRLGLALLLSAHLCGRTAGQDPSPSPSPSPAVLPTPPADPNSDLPVADPGGVQIAPLINTNPLQPETSLLPSRKVPGARDLAPATHSAEPTDEDRRRIASGVDAPKPADEGTNSLLLSDPLARTALQMGQTNAETFFDGVGGIPRPLSTLYLDRNLQTGTGFQRGSLSIDPTVSLGVNYREVSGSHNGNNSSELYGLLSPAFTAAFGEPATGRLINLSYLGSLILGPKGDRESQYDQSFATRAVLALDKVNLGLGLQFSELSGGTRDTGGADIGRELLGVSVTGNYEYSAKTNLETYLTAPIRIFQHGISSEGLTGTAFVNYVYSPLTTVGLGVSGGFLAVDNSRTQTFEQGLVRITFLGSKALTYNATVGFEFRDAGSKEEVNPVLGTGLIWEPRLGTRLILSADRRVENSAADVGANFVSSSVAVTITQRVTDFWQASASVGYENADYDRVDRVRSFQDRTDNYVVVQGGVTAFFNRHLGGSIVVTYGNNQSRVDGVNFFQSLIQVTYSY